MTKIVIADNDSLMRQAMRALIESVDGFEVAYEATNGQEVIDVCMQDDIAILFTDIRMPVKNGVMAIEELRKSKPNMEIYIITGCDSFEMAKFAVENGVKNYIVKPVIPQEIHDILTTYKEKAQAAPAVAMPIWQDDALQAAVSEQDFERVYFLLDKVVASLFELGTIEYRKKAGEALIDSLLKHVFPKSEGIDIPVLTEFPVSLAIVGDERRCKIWLFNCVDYIFKIMSVRNSYILDHVFTFIEEHIEEDISLSTIVKECNLSQGYLSRIIKSNFNMTLMNYIHLKKLNLAKQYLCDNQVNGSEVGYKLGYSNFSYFCKVFKKYENITISEFRSRANV